MVRSFGGVRSPWSPSAFVHLALTLSTGAVGALVASVAAACSTGARFHNGWWRSAFNFADYFLANMAALGVFRAVQHVSSKHLWIIAAGAVAGVCCFLINYALLFAPVRMSAHTSLRAFIADAAEVLPHDIAYGIGAAGFTIYAGSDGAPLLVACLALVMSAAGVVLILAHRTNAHLEATTRHAEERVELRGRIITAADAERAKIASDLHDGPVGDVTGLAMLLSTITTSFDDDAATIAEVRDVLDRVRRDLRTLTFQLSPHDLDKPGRLREEVAAQLDQLAERGIAVENGIPDVVPLDRSGVELLHRVCREALTNTLRHANAKHVAVATTHNTANVVLTIDDDGRGFTAEDIARQRAAGHFGTRFLAEKAEVLRGSFECSPTPGAGTHIMLTLPIAQVQVP
jgi:signal transduction histidine kinase